MSFGDLIISPFITILVFLFKSLAALPEQTPGQNTILAITLFAFLFRLATVSFMFQQRRSQEKAEEIQRRLEELRKIYANDSEKLAQAQVNLYQEVGFNPLTGCLLTLGKIPFIFGLYSAITIVLGGAPYQLFNLHGRVLLPSLSNIIPLPSRLTWLNLDQPNFVLAILAAIIIFRERTLAKKGQVDWLTYILPLVLGVLFASKLASGVAIFLIAFYLASIALYIAMESAGLRRLFLGREKTRRWKLQQALKRGVINANHFDHFTTDLLQPPNLNQDDIILAIKFLELGASGFEKTWPALLAGKAGKVLEQLSKSGEISRDLGALYYKFAECCFKFGYKEQAIELAMEGYACPQNRPESKTACVLLLARAESITQQARTIYKTFVRENKPDSDPVRKFARIFQDKSVITPETNADTARLRILLNACIVELLPGQTYYWAKSNLGLAYLILDELERAQGYFQETLMINPMDVMAIQCMAVIWFQMKQYDQSLQVIQAARQSGVNEAAIDTIEGLCQSVCWLTETQVNTSALNQIEGWYVKLQGPFPLRRFLAAEVAFIQGRLAEIIGDWGNARQHLESAYNAGGDNIKFAYHYAQLLQISGDWQLAAKILKEKKSNSSELLCLILKQVKHDTSLDQLDQKTARTANDVDAEELKERLVSARYALLTGHADAIPSWPAQLTFDTSEQADEWSAIWLSALIGRNAVNEAKKEMADKRYLRLPKPEQLFLAAAVKWLSRDLASAEKDLRETLRLAPNYENALRLFAAILETRGDAMQAYQLLERLTPNDHHTIIRGALLRWRKGEEKAAIAQLQKLASDSKIGPLAKFWMGRLLLIRAAKSLDAQDLQQAEEYLKWAADAGIPEASWYGWLCAARKDYNPKTGWGQKKAGQLIKKLPGPLTAIPVAGVATMAALVALETNNPTNMLDGCALLLGQLQDKRDKKTDGSVSLENWSEALWRTAEAVTSLNDRLVLSKLAHQVDESFAEHSRAARQIADATVMGTIMALAQSGENIDEILAEIEDAIQMTPNALIPRLAHTSLLIKKGTMTVQEAIAYLDQEKEKSAIAQALEECLHLTTDSHPTSIRPSGLAAFLTINKANLSNFVSILQTLSIEALDRHDEAFLLEMARCLAAADMHDDAIDLFSQIYETSHAQAVAKEFSDYLCHVVARSGITDSTRAIADLEKAQQLLSRAHTYCLEGAQ